ncbi:hypothetical protein KEM56_000792 [Ascosphaera pollenicola]|nr:hypothetical protein KEM56_000792 [Ascosphaera pollenicola]
MCGDLKAGFVSVAATDVFVDLLVVALPQPVIWRLHLPVSTKLLITGMVGMGLLSTGMGIARLVGMASTDFSDFTTATKDLHWCLIEIATGLFTCCAPSFKLLWRRDRGGSTSVSTKGNQAQSSPYEPPRRRPWYKFWRRGNSSVDDDSADDLPLSYYQPKQERCGPLHRDVLSQSMSNKTLTGDSPWAVEGTLRFGDNGGILVEKSITTY